jgi:hypothetical protein
MPRIIDAKVNLEYALGHHLHCLIAQIPTQVRRIDHGWAITDRVAQWNEVLMFPEVSLPVDRFEQALAFVDAHFRPNTVTIFGMEHVSVRTYRELMERFREDNAPAIDLVQQDIDSADILDAPVNWCAVVVKEASGRVRVFLEAKTHPYHREEFLDTHQDLYRGRHFWFFRCRPSPYNFMALICLDYLYRDLFASNIRQIIDHANDLFFTTRQTLDALFVIGCNPKPEHRAYRDVLSGFYGEYIEDTPGVRETVTVLGNCSDETLIHGYERGGAFGVSQVVIGPRHKLARVDLGEFSTDDMGGAPLWRVRFSTGTRLYHFNLPLHHEIDPRSSRIPLKVHAIMRRGRRGAWERLSGERIAADLGVER